MRGDSIRSHIPRLFPRPAALGTQQRAEPSALLPPWAPRTAGSPSSLPGPRLPSATPLLSGPCLPPSLLPAPTGASPASSPWRGKAPGGALRPASSSGHGNENRFSRPGRSQIRKSKPPILVRCSRRSAHQLDRRARPKLQLGLGEGSPQPPSARPQASPRPRGGGPALLCRAAAAPAPARPSMGDAGVPPGQG